MATASATLTAFEEGGMVPFSFTLEEDNVLPSLLGEIRSNMVRNFAELLDNLILNADTSVTMAACPSHTETDDSLRNTPKTPTRRGALSLRATLPDRPIARVRE